MDDWITAKLCVPESVLADSDGDDDVVVFVAVSKFEVVEAGMSDSFDFSNEVSVIPVGCSNVYVPPDELSLEVYDVDSS